MTAPHRVSRAVAPAASRLYWQRPGGDRGANRPAQNTPVAASVILLVLLVAACQRPSKPAPRPAANGPKIRATVITIQTTMPPSPKVLTHTIVIANGRARSSDEVDEWRLFDFDQKSVTFVDDLARTYRIVPFREILTSHRAAFARPLPEGMPHAEFIKGNEQKIMQGVAAKQSFIRIGSYQRELWIAVHPLIPADLFSMMQASAPQLSPLSGIMREADEALLGVRGYPMSDHAELPYEKRTLVVDHVVISIDQRDVSTELLHVNSSYKEVKPVVEPAKPQPQTK